MKPPVAVALLALVGSTPAWAEAEGRFEKRWIVGISSAHAGLVLPVKSWQETRQGGQLQVMIGAETGGRGTIALALALEAAGAMLAFDPALSEPNGWTAFLNLGAKVRLSFLTARLLSPWVAARIGFGWYGTASSACSPGRSQCSSGTSVGVGLSGGLDVAISEALQLGAAADYRACDWLYRENTGLACGEAIAITLGPLFRW